MFYDTYKLILMRDNRETFDCIELCGIKIICTNIDRDIQQLFGSLWYKFFSFKSTDYLQKDCVYVQKQHINGGECEDFIAFPNVSIKNTVNLESEVYRCIANVLLNQSIFHLHSSFIMYHGQALVFTGPSGIGKTTQAELWRDYQDALIVNGDACLLRRMEDDRWWAFGTPIHGSSPYCENEKAPIAAIITLEQGEENVLTRMDDFSALSYCLPEFYRPKMDEETEDIFWNSVDSLFQSVPVYHLVCRPDREATEIVKKEIFDV